MSGGYYEYVQSYGIDDILFDSDRHHLIARVADDLADAGEGDAANATRAALARIRQLRQAADEINGELNDLYGIWKALDWWKSGDSGEENLHEAVQAWRDKLAGEVDAGND